MPTSTNLATYADCKQVMDTAVAHNLRLTYQLHTEGDAINFRQRCYSFRKLLYMENREIPGMTAGTRYDALRIRIAGKSVIFEPHEASGIMLNDKGEVVQATVEIEEELDPLGLELVEKFKREKGDE